MGMMLMNNTKTYNFIYKIIFIFFFLILIGYSLHIELVVRIGTYGIFLCSVGLFCLGSIRGYIKDLDILKIFLLLFFSFFSVFVSAKYEYESFVKILMFMELPLLVVSLPPKIDKTVVQFYQKGFFLISLYYLGISFTGYAYSYQTQYGTTQLSALTLGNSNPNETAMFLFTVIFVLAFAFFISKNIFSKCFLAFSIVWTAYLIFLTQCRVMILLSIVLLGVSFFLRKRKPNFILTKFVQVFPAVFVGVLIFFSNFFSSITFMGDSFDTGRSTIYLRAFNDMSFVKFMVGDFAFKFQNLHNAPLAVFATIGVVGVVIFYSILFSKLSCMLKSANNCQKGYLSFWVIMMFVLHSSVEAALFTAGSASAICTFTVFLFAQYEVLDEDIAD